MIRFKMYRTKGPIWNAIMTTNCSNVYDMTEGSGPRMQFSRKCAQEVVGRDLPPASYQGLFTYGERGCWPLICQSHHVQWERKSRFQPSNPLRVLLPGTRWTDTALEFNGTLWSIRGIGPYKKWSNLIIELNRMEYLWGYSKDKTW